jgi:peptide/nickel transport system permease protein
MLSFLLIQMTPGGAIVSIVGEDPRIRKHPEMIEQIKHEYGLDKSIPEQYLGWLGKALTGDFGISFEYKQPVMEYLGEKFLNSLWLQLGGALLGFLGIPIGIWAAKRRGKFGDNLVRVLTVIGNAVPHWWLGLLLIILSASIYTATSNNGANAGFKPWPLDANISHTSGPLDVLWHLMIPTLLFSLAFIINYSRFVRAETLEVMRQDYVRTANAKGLSEKEVTNRHILRNALLVVVTLTTYLIPGLLGGAVLAETIFSYPGAGFAFIDAAGYRDYPVIMGETIILSALTLVSTVIGDVMYAVVDPRVRLT